MFILDICYDLAKYRGINIKDTDSTIKFFHHYQRLVFDSKQQDGLDPFPVKYIGNMKVLVESIGQMMKSLAQILTRRNR